jgi:phospholipase A-2-activating protein
MVQMFRKNGVAIAAQWSATSGTWIEVGEVTGTSNAGTIDGEDDPVRSSHMKV